VIDLLPSAPILRNFAAIIAIPILLTGCLSYSSSSLQLENACGITTPVTFTPELGFELVIDDLSAPVHLTHAGDGSGRIFVVERRGRIRIVQDDEVLIEPFLDIEDRVSLGGERGLLSVAFHPNYEENGRFFVYYNRNGDGASIISEYNVTADENQADPSSEQILLTITQPFSNHNGGLIKFGPDGYLYIGMGDGGSGGDPLENGQDRQTLLGALLRIDVDNTDANPYGIPADNPFVEVPDALDEIYAYGFRNPWRYSFDRCDGRLFLGDVGQSSFEEVDLVEKGGNYGWNTMEGSECFDPRFNCNPAGLELPIAEYGHGGGHCSITGGYVYRGTEYPSLIGHYLYGDFCSGQMFTAFQNEEGEWVDQQLERPGFSITSFGEDEAGNLYLVDIGGAVYKVTD